MGLSSPRLPGVFSRKTYSADDADNELFAGFSHDVGQCVDALEFLMAQNERILEKHWPSFCRANAAVSTLLERLAGVHSLESEDMDALCRTLSVCCSDSTHLAAVHPKERSFVVPSLQVEVAAFGQMAALLEQAARELWAPFVRLSESRIRTLLVHLKHIQSRLKLRSAFHDKYVALERMVLKLEKKLLAEPRDAKGNGARLSEARAALALASSRYSALNAKLKATLPESLLLVEEFVSTLVKYTLCRHREVAQMFAKKSRDLCQFYGFLDPHANTTVQDSGSIVDQWEAEATPTRLRIESLLLAIHKKNPDLLDKEMPGVDSSLAMTKTWLKLTRKVKDKHHKVKPKDRAAGIFNSHQMADPLSSFVQLQNVATDAMSSIHPSSKLAQTFRPPMPPVASKTPPPLPPRGNRGPFCIKLQETADQEELPRYSPAPMETCSPLNSSPLASSVAGRDSVFSPGMESQSSFGLDDNETMSSLHGIRAQEDSNSDAATEKLAKFYSKQRNEITEAPISPSAMALDSQDWRQALKDLLDLNDSETQKLIELSFFYKKAIASDNVIKRVTAKKDYAGEEPGDLSFKAGEVIEVLFDLQLTVLTYNDTGENWLLGAIPDHKQKEFRMGLVPNTHV